MTPRLNPAAIRLGLIKPLIDLGTSCREGIDPTLSELILIRASQINGCSGCLFMHARDARKHGETEDRIYQLNAWRESPLYTERERAALACTVTRLCLDVMKSAHRRRESYVGPWLPEPMVEAEADELDDVTLPLMMALERLSPLERAAFLLHDVFGAGFDEIADTIGHDPATCRQLASRARTHVRAQRPRFRISKERGLEIAEAFFTASRGGDLTMLRSLLAADVAVHADGGGKRPAAMTPIIGIEEVLRVHAMLARVFVEHPSQMVRRCLINGLPGFVTVEGGDTLQTTALEIVDGKIAGIYVVRNPDKLQHLRDVGVH